MNLLNCFKLKKIADQRSKSCSFLFYVFNGDNYRKAYGDVRLCIMICLTKFVNRLLISAIDVTQWGDRLCIEGRFFTLFVLH